MSVEIELLLSQTKIFSSLSQPALKHLAEAISICSFKKGELLIQEDHFTKGCYVILSGKGMVFSLNNQAGIKKIITTVGQDSLLGELSTVMNERALFSVEAAEDIKCLFLDGIIFRKLLATHPKISQQLLPIIIERVHQLVMVLMK